MYVQLTNNSVKGGAISGQMRGSSARDWKAAGKLPGAGGEFVACSAHWAVAPSGCYLVGPHVDSLPSRAEPCLQGGSINIKREGDCPIGWLGDPSPARESSQQVPVRHTDKSKGF